MTDITPETELPEDLLRILKAAARALDELPNTLHLYGDRELDVAGVSSMLSSFIAILELTDNLALLGEAREHLDLATAAMARGNLRDWKKHQDRAQSIVRAVQGAGF